MLYDETHTEVDDWFAVCPNAVSEYEAPLPKRLFDVLRLYTSEWDRTQVAQALVGMKGSLDFAIHVLMRTYPDNMGIQMCAREFAHRIPQKMVASILALSHNGVGRKRLMFPDKRQRPVSKTILKAFGLRGSERVWVHRLAKDKEFVRSVSLSLTKDDLDFLTIPNKGTLPKKSEERTTAPLPGGKQDALF